MRQLVIGNKNDASWSLRPWLLLRHVEVQRIPDYSLTGRMPDAYRWKAAAESEAGRLGHDAP